MTDTEKKARGGAREGAGRKDLGRHCRITARISPEAKAILETKENASEWIDHLILKNK